MLSVDFSYPLSPWTRRNSAECQISALPTSARTHARTHTHTHTHTVSWVLLKSSRIQFKITNFLHMPVSQESFNGDTELQSCYQENFWSNSLLGALFAHLSLIYLFPSSLFWFSFVCCICFEFFCFLNRYESLHVWILSFCPDTPVFVRLSISAGVDISLPKNPPSLPLHTVGLHILALGHLSKRWVEVAFVPGQMLREPACDSLGLSLWPSIHRVPGGD